MKTYVKIQHNKCAFYMQSHIRPKDKVIVTDGSYMEAKDKSYVSGIQFRQDPHIGCNTYELLTVKQTNKRRLPTPDNKFGEVLSYFNNCIIVDGDGNEFYCSLVNIKKFIQ